MREFSYRGVPLGDVKLPGLDGRRDVVLSALHVDARGWLYVAENKLSEVYVYDESRKLVARFGTVGYDRGQFVAISASRPTRRASTSSTRWGRRCRCSTAAAAGCAGGASTRSGPEAFSLPSGIAVAASGKVFVADALRHEVKVFAPDGAFLGRFGGRGRALGDFGYPGQLAFDSEGALLVVEKLNGRVQRFRVTEPRTIPDPAAQPDAQAQLEPQTATSAP